MAKQPIQESRTIKYLGIHFQHNLGWKQHVLQTKIKASKTVTAISRMMGFKWGLPSDLRKLAHEAVVAPIVTYGAPAWHSGLESTENIKTIRTIEQRMACRYLRACRTTK